MSEAIHSDYLTSETNSEPRKKCCGECVFRRSDPQLLQADVEFWRDMETRWTEGWDIFYCAHTIDDRGRNQVCAGYQTLYGRHILLQHS